MVLSHKVALVASLGFDETGRSVVNWLHSLKFPIHHVEDLRDKEGKRVVILFGVSKPIAGSALRSVLFQGKRCVPFMVRLVGRTPTETELLLVAGGSESLVGTDFGRKRQVLESILDGLPGKVVDVPAEGPEDELPAWRERAPGL